MPPTEERLRLVELLGSLSLATDLGTGQPLGHGIRTCRLAVAIARNMGLDQDEIRTVLQVALLRFLGCTADASESARAVGGDDIGFNANMGPVFNGSAGGVLREMARTVGAGESWPRRSRLLLAMITDLGGPSDALAAHCEVAAILAGRLGLDESVTGALRFAYERWDGKGYPTGISGTDIPLAVRVSTVARDVDVLADAGLDPAVVLRERRGKGYDPDVVDAWLALSDPVMEADWDALLALEPTPHEHIRDLDAALTAVADFSDLKSPWTRGHSREVSRIASDAAAKAGLDDGVVRGLLRAGLVHDVGRVGVENGIWDKSGPLSVDEWEKVRLHPYLTGRVLSRFAGVGDLVSLASCHHERLDGSGYHSGLRSDGLSRDQNILAAADVLAALRADRPHRPALTAESAFAVLAGEAEEGRLAAEAVAMVTASEGGDLVPVRARRNTDGLTDRELEVLVQISRGHTNREVAERLFISPKTVGRHVENIYAKIGVSTRAGAAVYAMEHGLLG